MKHLVYSLLLAITIIGSSAILHEAVHAYQGHISGMIPVGLSTDGYNLYWNVKTYSIDKYNAYAEAYNKHEIEAYSIQAVYIIVVLKLFSISFHRSVNKQRLTYYLTD